jgi:transposase-like protein
MTESRSSDQRVPRRWPLAEKRRIVELTLREGASISAIAREHGLHPTCLSHWRSTYRDGTLVGRSPRTPRASNGASSTTLLPVTITSASASPEGLSRMPVVRASNGSGQEINSVRLTFSSGTTLEVQTRTLDSAFVCALIAQAQR